MPPVYYTAEVEPQTSLTIGGGYIGYNYYEPGSYYNYEEAQGGRIDITYRYAGDPKHYIQAEKMARLWEKLAVIIEGSLIVTDGGFGFDFPDSTTKVVPLCEVGLQYEFCERPSLSAGIGVLGWFYYGYPSITLMAGLPLWPEKREIITVGVKTLLWNPYSAFVTIHPLKRMHLTIQTNPMTFFSSEEWELQVGMGLDIINR